MSRLGIGAGAADNDCLGDRLQIEYPSRYRVPDPGTGTQAIPLCATGIFKVPPPGHLIAADLPRRVTLPQIVCFTLARNRR
jgi:hypothetical protein